MLCCTYLPLVHHHVRSDLQSILYENHRAEAEPDNFPLSHSCVFSLLSLSEHCCFTSCFVRTHSDTQPEGAELRHQKQKGEKFKRRLPTELNEHERNSHEQELSARFSTVSEESASSARMNHKESKRVSHCCSGRFFLYDPRKTPFCLR